MIAVLHDRRTQIVLLGMAIFIVVSLTYFGFRMPYHYYLPMIHIAQNPGAFGLDPVLANSVYLKASIYYDLIAYTGIPITNDVLGLGLHYALNGMVLWLLWQVARDVLNIKDPLAALTLVLVSCFFYSKFVMGATASPIAFNTPTPTGLAQIAGMAALLLLLRRQYLAAAILAALCVGFNPKGNILIVPGLVFYLLIDRDVPRRALLWALVPLGYVAWRALDPAAGIAPEDASRMIVNIMQREQEDGLFSAQPPLAKILFAVAILSWPVLARQIPNPAFRRLGWAFLTVTVGAVLVNLIYEPYAAQYPIPVLIMLAIPLTTKHFLFLYAVAIVAWILTTDRLSWHERVSLLIAFVVLKVFVPQAALAAAIAIAGVGLPRLYAWAAGPQSAPLRALAMVSIVPLPVVMSILLGGFVLMRSGTSYLGPSWIDRIAYRETGTWSTGVFANQATWRAWQQLGKQSGDFPLLAIYRLEASPYPGIPPGKYTSHTYAAVTARKSPFATLPAGAYLNLKLWRESQKRWEIRQEILERLNAGRPIDDSFIGTVTIRKEGLQLPINETLTGFLKKRRARILVPSALAPLFPASVPKERVGAHVLIDFAL